MSQEIAQNLSKLIQTFNDKRVISEAEIKEVLSAIVAILAENKKEVGSLNSETKKQLEVALAYIEEEHKTLIQSIRGDLRLSKFQIEQSTKEQNNRAFKRLQELLSKVKIPADGKDGKDGEKGEPGVDGSPDTPEQVRDKLETLREEERLDAKAIKNLPETMERVKKMPVGGIRFLENLADVSVPITDKRQDVLVQYDTTDKRWESGLALSVGLAAPTSPKVNDLWVDTN